MTKAAEPCADGWESADPGAGSFSPNPCVRCEWSREDHAKVENDRAIRNEVLVAVNDALEAHGLSIARGRIDGEDVYQVLPLPSARAASQNEICICAAVRLDDGRIIRGHRHHNCIHVAAEWHKAGQAIRLPIRDDQQGFLTSRGRFVDRAEGLSLMRASGWHHELIGSVLTSEDLY